MDNLKSVLEGMIEKNTIKKNGEQNESFFVIDETDVLEHDTNNESIKSLESFVNDEFYSVITNRIRLELNLAVEKALNANILPAVNETKTDKNELKMEDNYQKL